MRCMPSVASRLSVNSSNQNGISANGLSGIFLSLLEESCSVAWWRVRHHALILNPKMNVMQSCYQVLGAHLVPTNPVVAL